MPLFSKTILPSLQRCCNLLECQYWPPCEYSLYPFVFLIEEEKRRLSFNHVKPPAQTFKLPVVSLVFFRQTVFFSKVNIRLLISLGLKLYPSNMQRMLNKDLTLFMHSLVRVCGWVVRNDKPKTYKSLLYSLWLQLLHLHVSATFPSSPITWSKWLFLLSFYGMTTRKDVLKIQGSKKKFNSRLSFGQAALTFCLPAATSCLS